MATTRDRRQNDSDETSRLGIYSRLIISITQSNSKKFIDEVRRWIYKRWKIYTLSLLRFFLGRFHQISTTYFEPLHYEIFVWQALFSKALPATDFSTVTTRNYRVCEAPWHVFQSVGLNLRRLRTRPMYPRLCTQGIDVFIAQTPYPAEISDSTALVVRYHDTFPVFMPHMFANKLRHHSNHFHALRSNIEHGAWFACVSETTRRSLLSIAPELSNRAVTIPNMVSHEFFDDDRPVSSITEIIKSRLNSDAPDAVPVFSGLSESQRFYDKHLGRQNIRYILVVSTIEPRKNHTIIASVLAMLRTELDPMIKLVIVGSVGWDANPIMREMRPWIENGTAFLLHKIPAAELRVLYKYASATVCPSLAEGFDFSGIECMRSGGVVVASDIAVHQEIYEDAAIYFDPYSARSLFDALRSVLHGPDAEALGELVKARGARISKRFLPEHVLPQWERFLTQVTNSHHR
ncbi:glycosyltransferase family 1 protein [Burkholderia sp. Ax-1719]|uniref:glycosyltransferase family 4 protein n=1 Tax=Burkholderia sp. Ax-1719 TaxID=2608334 RepID=UPI00142335C4|nr:glycosyltransferase family 1 protein [Burkholderia sp. Ax-1719]